MTEALRQIGPYQLEGVLGVGGFGTVFRARDPRLERQVAIKLLKPELNEKTEFVRRFEREARAVAKLRHPNICALFDIGEDHGKHFLVMEYLEGKTLSTLMKRGKLSLDRVLKISAEIAGALAAAHASGIVHRDLKPGNVMITDSGTKLLDFGLAKSVTDEEPLKIGQHEATLTESPLTSQGQILGTMYYMAPEQLEGRVVDARTDIFALGLIMYEMLTGKRAFRGQSGLEAAASVLRDEPEEISESRPDVHPLLAEMIRSCLAKNPNDRWQNASDVQREILRLKDYIPNAGKTIRTSKRSFAPWLVALFLLAALPAFYFLGRSNQKPATPHSLKRLEINLPKDFRTGSLAHQYFALSPDGQTLAVIAGKGSVRSVHLRRLDGREIEPVLGTEEAETVFWSPDGTKLAFIARGKLKKIDLKSGFVMELEEATASGGGHWGEDGSLVFTKDLKIYRVPEVGGGAQPVATPADKAFTAPQILPGGRYILAAGNYPDPAVPAQEMWVIDSETGEGVNLGRSLSAAHFVAPGYLAYLSDWRVVMRPFSMKTRSFTGPPVPITDRLPSPTVVGVPFAVAGDTLVFHESESSSEFRFYGPHGEDLRRVETPYDPSLMSLKGNTAVITLGNRRSSNFTDIWLFDVTNEAFSQLTTYDVPSFSPMLTYDQRGIFFSQPNRGVRIAYVDIDQPENLTWVTPVDHIFFPRSVSRDGRLVSVHQVSAKEEIWIHERQADGSFSNRPLIQAGTSLEGAQISPDGNWIAYLVRSSNSWILNIASVEDPSLKWRVPARIPRWPSWSQDGKYLYYHEDQVLSRIEVRVGGGEIEMGNPEGLFSMPGGYQFRVGENFEIYALVAKAGGQAPPFSVVVNWEGLLVEP